MCLLSLAVASCWYVPVFARASVDAVTLSVARAALIQEGWQPLETYGAFPDGLRWSQDGDTGVLYRNGFKEVEACSGTGANYCSFNYVRGVKCLTLHTQGEFEAGKYEPLVIRRTHVCPRPEVMVPSKAQP